MLDNDVSVDMTTLNYIDITIELLETIKSKQLFFWDDSGKDDPSRILIDSPSYNIEYWI